MTKLTKEQIEQERVKFEEWVDNYYGIKLEFRRVNNNLLCGYTDHNLTIMWHAWVSRAEIDKA